MDWVCTLILQWQSQIHFHLFPMFDNISDLVSNCTSTEMQCCCRSIFQDGLPRVLSSSVNEHKECPQLNLNLSRVKQKSPPIPKTQGLTDTDDATGNTLENTNKLENSRICCMQRWLSGPAQNSEIWLDVSHVRGGALKLDIRSKTTTLIIIIYIITIIITFLFY